MVLGKGPAAGSVQQTAAAGDSAGPAERVNETGKDPEGILLNGSEERISDNGAQPFLISISVDLVCLSKQVSGSRKLVETD